MGSDILKKSDSRIMSILSMGNYILEGIDPEGALVGGTPVTVIVSVADDSLNFRVDMSFVTDDILSVMGVIRNNGSFSISGLFFRTPPWKSEQLNCPEGANTIKEAIEGLGDLPVLCRILSNPQSRKGENCLVRIKDGFRAVRSSVLWNMESESYSSNFLKFCVEYQSEGKAKVTSSVELPAGRVVVSTAVTCHGLKDREVLFYANMSGGIFEAKCLSHDGNPSVKCAMELEQKIRTNEKPNQRILSKKIPKTDCSRE